MQVTKFSHSCILIDDGQTKLLFDPGLYGGVPQDLTVDAIVITHVHQDHVDIDVLKPLLANNPRIITNFEVKAELDKHDIACEIVEEGSTVSVGSYTLEAFGNEHAVMHPELPKFQNTGYLINDSIFHPGDALLVPSKPVKTLLLPVAAPWSKVEETLDYITKIQADINFPIHDGFIRGGGGAFYRFAKMWCEKLNVQFIDPELGKAYEI
ncbi:MBL fold metallo-hydrolase [bacterium]|nr:MAG: MBL fold metallo-hydrolase [bacterium]